MTDNRELVSEYSAVSVGEILTQYLSFMGIDFTEFLHIFTPYTTHYHTDFE